MAVVPFTPNLPVVAAAPAGEEVLRLTDEQRIELLEMWRSIAKRRWMILGLAAAATLLAWVISLAMTPVYRATATLMIDAGKSKIVSIEEIHSVGQQREFFQSQVEILQSREVLGRTVDALGLTGHPDFQKPAGEQSWLDRIQQVAGVEALEPAPAEEAARSAAVRRLEAVVKASPLRNSQIVQISAEHPDRGLAVRIANSLSEQYIRSDRDSRLKVAQDASAYLTDRLSSLREKLVSSEEALQAYRDAKKIINLGGSAQTTTAQMIAGTSDKLTEARAKRLELESALVQARAARAAEYADAPTVMRDPSVIETLRKANEARQQLNEAQQMLGPNHPKLLQLQAQAQLLDQQLQTQRSAVVATLTREHGVAQGQEQALQRALESAKDLAQGVNRQEFELQVLERDVQSNRQLYDLFLSRAKETDATGDIQAPVARVIDKAEAPTEPVRPRKALIVAMAALMALMLGAGASIVLDRLDNTIKGADDAELRLSQPVLAAVPKVAGVPETGMARLFLDDVNSHYAEAIRTARTGVMLSSIDVKHKIVLVTSSLANEGKTTVTMNLALAHAQTRKTLLIDCDMRRAQASRRLGAMPGTKGLSNLVAGTNSARECIFPARDSTLHVMPVGDLPPVPLEMLLSARLRLVISELSKHYEVVLIDSPPVEVVSDGLVLAPLATGVVFVVKAMSTPAPLARKALMRLQRGGATLLGVVVNDLDFEHAQTYYGEYAAPSYGYGGQEEIAAPGALGGSRLERAAEPGPAGGGGFGQWARVAAGRVRSARWAGPSRRAGQGAGMGVAPAPGNGSLNGVGNGALNGTAHGAGNGVGHGGVNGFGHGSANGLANGSAIGSGHDAESFAGRGADAR